MTCRLLALGSLLAIAAFGANTGWSPTYVGSGNGCKAGGTCYYVDYETGSDSNNGTAKATPWKSVPGMACATGAAAAHTVSATDQIILKGGVTWPASCFPWTISSGGASSPNGSGYPGLYIGYDPTWNKGTVVSVRVTDPGSCAAGTSLSVSLTGGGGSAATGTAQIETDTDDSPNGPSAAGDLQFVTVTGAGSGYTSNPTVSFTGSCTSLPVAYADIYSPVMSGSGTTWGTSSGVPVMFTITSQRATIDHLEFKDFLFYSGAGYTGGGPNMIGAWGADQIVQNLYIHNFGMGAPVSGNIGGNDARDDRQTAAVTGSSSNGTLSNSIINNYETEAYGCVNGRTAPQTCVQGVGVSGFQRILNNVINGWRGGVYTLADSATYEVAGNKMWAILCDVKSQHPDAFYFNGSTVAYNNILRDIYSGAAAFYVETMEGSGLGLRSYLFNNVVFGRGTRGSGSSTPPVGWTSEFPASSQPNPTPDLRAYNNTLYSLHGSTNCVNAGQWFGSSGSFSVGFTIANTHCISDQSQSHWIETGGYGTWNTVAGSNTSAINVALDPKAAVQSPSTASGQGYVAANNFAPTAASSSTVTFGGENLTSLCSTSVGGISLAPLCADIKGVARPANGAWNAGAYQYVGVVRPVDCSGDITTALQAAITASADGDVVSIGAGSCTQSAMLSWSDKSIELKGAGVGTTTLTATHANSLLGVFMNNGSHTAWSIHDFTWNSSPTNNYASHQIHAEDASGPVAGWRIHHMRFGDPGFAIYGLNYALMDHNYFDNSNPSGKQSIAIMLAANVSGASFDGACSPVLSGCYSMSLPTTLGTGNALFIEDNTFDGGVLTNRAVLDSDSGGGRAVLRHNTVISEYFYAHWARTNTINFTLYEVYGNSWSGYTGNVGRMEGGTGVFWGNTVTSGYQGLAIDDRRGEQINDGASNGPVLNYCDGTHAWDGNIEASGWPCLGQVGRGSGTLGNQISQPLWAWNNGLEATCATGGACTNTRNIGVINLGGPVLSTVFLKSTPHSNGEVDFVNGGSTPKPGYVEYTYPHPLAGGIAPPVVLSRPRSVSGRTSVRGGAVIR